MVAALDGPAVDLACGLALCPMTDDVLTRLGCDEGGGDVFDFPAAELVDLLLEVSASGPVAYLEAELFGGYGTQAAAVWDRCRLVAGPTRYDFEAPDARPRSQWPFNMAPRRLGVRATVTSDEFDIAGLGRHRTTDAWSDDPDDPTRPVRRPSRRLPAVTEERFYPPTAIRRRPARWVPPLRRPETEPTSSDAK